LLIFFFFCSWLIFLFRAAAIFNNQGFRHPGGPAFKTAAKLLLLFWDGEGKPV
jgi:hypothetical protein